ncbi:protein translocase subunit SecF [Candidatus Dependentiae bacterium]|nr:MAG: protein translocase subunit SecF [Candidatus Dependentiae bacterium]
MGGEFPMINFVKYRAVTAFISLFLIGGFIGFAVYKKRTTGEVFRYGVDFTGGAQVLLRFSKPVSSIAIKDILDKNGWEGAVIREFADNELLVRVKLEEVAKELGSVAERMQQVIEKSMKDVQVTILQSEAVGPGVGEALRGKSIRAIVFALIAMLLYIALRFWSFGFALGAVMALFHDAILMLAVFLLLNREISVNVIGAVLAVMGYSINDTIVIFSQIRNNLAKLSHESLGTIVNISINQTLRRTILTSVSTGLTVLSMLILGGEALRDFSIALLVGIIIGTYSSIYIASPVMMLLYRDKKA